MSDLIPNIEWTEAYYNSFSNILTRLLKLFKKLQGDTNVRIIICTTFVVS